MIFRTCALAGLVLLGACGSHGGTTGSASSDGVWPGFVELGAFGRECTAAMATEPAKAVGPLHFIPCTSGESNCEELKWDGGVTYSMGGDDLLEFDLQFVRDELGQATRLLVRHHYPVGDSWGINPYEAVLYDLASGAPLAVLRNIGGRGPFGEGSDCFVVPIASTHGLWLVGAQSRSDSVLAAHIAVPGPLSSPFRAVPVDATYLSNAALAFDDRLALSQSDGKIVMAAADGSAGSAYGPGQRVWLAGVVGDRFLAVNDKGAGGPHYFVLDRTLQFAEYGGTDSLSTDGARVAFTRSGAAGLEAWTVAPSDGKSEARLLATIPPPSQQPGDPTTLGLFGSAMSDGAYVLLTNAQAFGPRTGAITANVIDIGTGSVKSDQVLSDAEGAKLGELRSVIGYAQKYVWFSQATAGNGAAKVLRVRVPGL
jgi:hypothetical protein